jgi:molybdopterin-biosynthesis enzyme MoeA-like protein
MGFGLIIIGDELLSGKRQDKHFAQVIRLLGARGLALDWCRVIGDEARLIVNTLRETMATDDAVFCCGGIGVTPDDLTRACAAEAAGVPLQRHPEAVQEIEARYGAGLSPARLRLAELPAGSTIIPNPFNGVPGFSLGRHHFLPGFPEMAWPMMEALLDGAYRHLHRPRPPVEHAMQVQAREGQLLALMEECVRRYPDCRLSSLPELDPERPRLELAVRGEEGRAGEALVFLQQGLAALGIAWRALPAR